MVAALLVPFVGPASALSTGSITYVANVTAGTWSNIGSTETIFDLPTWESAAGSYVYSSLPSTPTGYAWFDPMLYSPSMPTGTLSRSYTVNAAGAIVGGQHVYNGAVVTADKVSVTAAGVPYLDSVNGSPATPAQEGVVCAEGSTIINGAGTVTLTGSDWTYEPATTVMNAAGTVVTLPAGYYDRTSSMSITNPAPGSSTSANVTVEIYTSLWVPSGVTGAITCTSVAPSSSVFSSGSGPIAIVGNSTANIAVESAPSLSSSGGTIGTIDLTENAAGALYDKNNNSVLTLTLPPGFSWNTPTAAEFSFMWGDSSLVTEFSTPTITSDNRELKFYNDAAATTSATFLKFAGSVSVDESTAKTGPITVTLGGQTSTNVSSLVVGNYGQFGLTAAAQSAPAIVAGKEGLNVGEIELKEGIPGSFITSRTITLTLPTDVAWTEDPTIDATLSTNDGGVGFTWTPVGTDGTEIQGTMTGAGTANQTTGADVFLKNMEVTPAVDFTGPVVVTVGGSEGVTGTLTVATVSAGVSAAAATTPTVQIGSGGQTLGDFTVTELAAGNLDSSITTSYLDNLNTDGSTEYLANTNSPEPGGYANLYVIAPVGVTFDTTPVVTVTAGDLELGTITTGTALNTTSLTTASNQGYIQIPIKSSSTTASTIKIAAPVVTIDRTVPEGPVTFKIKGTAVDETTFTNAVGSQLFPNDTTAVAVNVASVGTGSGAAGTGATTVFTINKTGYIQNGQTVTMDVAPYIKDSRTFLPLRYVANALGVADSNIIWDASTQKVTIIKGSMVVQLTIGSTTMLLNGASITMDTAPEITSGRTCLPVAWVGQALGASLVWDATAQTVTVTSI
jgi:hypothetical protein